MGHLQPCSWWINELAPVRKYLNINLKNSVPINIEVGVRVCAVNQGWALGDIDAAAQIPVVPTSPELANWPYTSLYMTS